MEFHQLRNFLAVVSTGNFSRAATKCRVAQPSLSKAIQKLEVEIGEKLFIRKKRGTLLTAAGEILHRHALRIIDEVEQTKIELAEANELRRGAVNVGVLPSISPYFLPRVLARFARTFPGLDVLAVEERTAALLRLIESGGLDLALVTLPIPKTGFEKETLFKEELLLAVPSKHPLATQPKIRLKDLEAEPFILMKEGHCVADQVLTLCRKQNLRLPVVFESAQPETLQSLVIAGLGITLVPKMAATGRGVPLVYRSLENPKPTRTITVIWRSGHEHTRAAAAFLNELRETGKAFADTLGKRRFSRRAKSDGADHDGRKNRS